MVDRPLDHPLEARGRLGVLIGIDDQARQFLVEIAAQLIAQSVEVDAAGMQHGGRILVVGQRQQQMLERGVFMATLVRIPQGAVQALL